MMPVSLDIPPLTVGTFLLCMRQLLEIRWTQNCRARDAEGLPCRAESPEAVAWSIYGVRDAIVRMHPETAPLGDQALEAIRWAITRREGLGRGGVFQFNDRHDRIRPDVYKVVDAAMGRVK